LKLLEYHRVRTEEELSWDRERLEREAGAQFIAETEALLPAHEEKWRPDHLIHISREPWMENCIQLCELYAAAGEPQRTWLRSRIDRNNDGKLGVFALRTAVLAAREHSPSLARAALIAYAIRDLAATDIRGVLMGLSLLCHCAGLARADVPALLREVAGMAGAALRVLYGEWADRYPGVQAIGSMGWRQIETDEGVGFQMG
jgi:hypothetical protein